MNAAGVLIAVSLLLLLVLAVAALFKAGERARSPDAEDLDDLRDR